MQKQALIYIQLTFDKEAEAQWGKDGNEKNGQLCAKNLM